MKRIVLAATVVALAGCSSKPLTNTDQEKLDDQVMWMSAQGKAHSVSSLKADYKIETGKDLPRPENTLQCGWDSSCYYNEWQLSFDKNIKIYQAEQEAKLVEQKLEQERECLANPECMKEREIAKHSSSAIESYNYFTGRYAGNGDEYDYISRRMCDRIITEQKKGASLNDVVGMVVSAPGGDYADRMYIMTLAKSCWYLGGLGITSSDDIFPHRSY